MGDGVHVESDVLHRERVDRLFEFAIGSAEVGRHILHLHGRADIASTMIANIRQYDRLYRLDDLYRDPFDHGLRMLIGGNPILFVGIGMTESDINERLQYFVSNSPIRRPAPLLYATQPVIELGAERRALAAKEPIGAIDDDQRRELHLEQIAIREITLAAFHHLAKR